MTFAIVPCPTLCQSPCSLAGSFPLNSLFGMILMQPVAVRAAACGLVCAGKRHGSTHARMLALVSQHCLRGAATYSAGGFSLPPVPCRLSVRTTWRCVRTIGPAVPLCFWLGYRRQNSRALTGLSGPSGWSRPTGVPLLPVGSVFWPRLAPLWRAVRLTTADNQVHDNP